MKKNFGKNKIDKTPPTFQQALEDGTFASFMQNWSSEQLWPVSDVYNAIVYGRDRDCGKITVIDIPCGGGKSSLLRGLAVLAGERKRSLVMMTDNNERLRDDITEAIERQGGEVALRRKYDASSVNNNIKSNIVWLSNGAPVTGAMWQSLTTSSLIALSTQRYMMVNNDVRDNINSIRLYGKTRKKDALVCDEAFEDVTERMHYYSDIKQFSGILRETIRPEREWESNIGETADRAERYADKLISDLKLEISRINKIELPVSKDTPAPEGHMLIDRYLGRKDRFEESGKIWRDKWAEIINIITEIRNDIKKIRKEDRSGLENEIFERYGNIARMMKNISTSTEPETILSTLERLEKLTELLPVSCGAELRESINICIDNAENYYALPELERIIRNNRDNMYSNSEHIRDRAITTEQFLDIFRTENVVFIQASNYGTDKEDDLTGQIKIHVFRYNIRFLPYKDMPCYLLDGTSSVSPVYDNKEIFQICKYEKPRTHVGIIQLDEKMSKTYLQREENVDRLYESVSDFLMETYGPKRLNPQKIMISGFKSCGNAAAKYGLAEPEGYIPDGSERGLIWDPERIDLRTGQFGSYGPISQKKYATFGGSSVTGSNEYKDCSLLCKISVLRMRQQTVFGQICCRNREFLEKLDAMDESYRARQLQLIWAYGAERSDFHDIIEDVTLRSALVDIIQEVNRLRIRYWCNDLADVDKYDVTMIWAIRGRKQGTYDMADEDFYEKLMRMTLEYFGCDCSNREDYIYIPSKMHPRLKSTEKIGTMMYKISKWYDELPDGHTFTMADMAEGIGVSKKSLNSLLSKEQNKEFLEKLRGKDSCNVKKTTGRAGYIYRKPGKESPESVMKYEKLIKSLNVKYSFSFSKPPYFVKNGCEIVIANTRGNVTLCNVLDVEYSDVKKICEKAAVKYAPKKRKKAIILNVPDEELDKMDAETVIEMLRKTITKNNEMEYGECKDKLPETYADMYFALYQHDKILTLRFPAELRKEDIDVPVDRVTAREIYYKLSPYCNVVY